MGTITATKDTILKANNEDSDELAPEKKIQIPAGAKIEVTSVVDDNNQHVKLTLAKQEITTWDEGFVYEPHWDVPFDLFPREIKLGVKYRSQLDNYTGDHGSGMRQCSLTSRAIALDHALKKYGQEGLDERALKNGFREGEGWYGRILKKYGDTTEHAPNVKAYKDFGVESYFSTTASAKDLITALQHEVCIPISVKYKAWGHIICVVGYDPKEKFFWVHDPYGSRAGAADYYAVRGGNAGAYEKYSMSLMSQLFDFAGDSKETGWAHFITSVAGNATGVPQGL